MQSFCTLPTSWSSSSIQHPGTCPTGSLELAPQEWTRTSPTKPDYRVTFLRTHRHTVLGIPVVGWPRKHRNHRDWVASLTPQSPATLWQLVPLGLPGIHYGSRDYHHLPG